MPTIQSIWDSVVKLLNDGISVIPIRDKDETNSEGKTLAKKSPYSSWTKYQSQIVTKEELWFLLEKFNTPAIATICGKISGNLEAIDIDVKWSAGIDKILFSEIKNIFPDLYKRLRIHQSPSGGYHILYRTESGVIPGNKKLASRPSTEEELKADPKSKTKCFIETRGEGGYVAAPPSVGYTIVQDVPIPVISWEEREALINICLSFSSIQKEEAYKPTKNDNIYYSENPFEHFNKSADGETVLLDNGWKFHSKNSRAANFIRPGSKSGGIHASFLFERRLFIFFTTNTEFDNERCYHPATILGRLAFNGDMKKCYSHLVNNGYGRIRPEVESKLVKSKAINNKALPANISEQAKVNYGIIATDLKDAHPYGIFWELDEKGEIKINREHLYDVANGLGFRLYDQNLVQVVEKFVHSREERFFYDAIKDYVKEEDGDLLVKIYNAYEDWIEKHGKFCITRLMILEETNLISDTSQWCYKFFKNGYLFITEESIRFYKYEENITGLILYSKVQERDYYEGAITGKYIEFLKHACKYNTAEGKYIESAIGYLSHEYKDESTGYIIVLTEECPDPKQGGGSGKNIFTNLLKQTTTVANKPGSQVKFDEKFLQSWNNERIFALSDVPKHFDFLFLKELSTGSGIIKKLFKDEREVPVAKMPKILIQTNYSYEVKDGGLERRIIPIEFTNFFTKAGGVDVHFGCYFPDGWSQEDWIGFDNFIAKSVQAWLQSGRKLKATGLSVGGTIKQFDQTYGTATREFIEEHWQEWSTKCEIENEEFKKIYDEYCAVNIIANQYKVSAIKMNKALEDWCKIHGYIFNKDHQIWDGVANKRAKSFRPSALPF
jgi:hypothetical protein